MKKPLFNVLTDEVLYLVTPKGQTIVVRSTDIKFRTAVELFKRYMGDARYEDSWEDIYSYLQPDLQEVKEEFYEAANLLNHKIEFANSRLYLDDIEVENSIADEILIRKRDGLQTEPLLKFLIKLYSNPFQHARESLFNFLRSYSYPITDEGNVIGYKGVTRDYLDVYSGKVDNTPGVEIPRLKPYEADTDPRAICSRGYHIGSWDFVKGFVPFDGHTLIVEFDPSDVISVPHEGLVEKIRVFHYKVLGEIAQEDGPLPITAYAPVTPAQYKMEADPLSGLPGVVDDYNLFKEIAEALRIRHDDDLVDIINDRVKNWERLKELYTLVINHGYDFSAYLALHSIEGKSYEDWLLVDYKVKKVLNAVKEDFDIED